MLFADEHDLEELPETNYCSRVAAKIFKLLLGFRSWKLAHGESDWIKASVAWVSERLISEHPPKMIRRALNLLFDLGIVDRILSSETRIKGKGRWKNPALTWFYQIKIDLDDWVKSTQAVESIMPKHSHIDPQSSKNLTTVVEDLENFSIKEIKEGSDQREEQIETNDAKTSSSIKEGNDQREEQMETNDAKTSSSIKDGNDQENLKLVSSIKNKRKAEGNQKLLDLKAKIAERSEHRKLSQISNLLDFPEESDSPAGVDENVNGSEDFDRGEDLTFDQMDALETERQSELEQIEDLQIVLYPKLLRLILAVPILRLQNAIGAMRQQDRNKRDKGERIKDPAGFLNLAIIRGYEPNKKSANLFNGSGEYYQPKKELTTLDYLWRIYGSSKDQFFESALYYGHSESSIKVFLSNK